MEFDHKRVWTWKSPMSTAERECIQHPLILCVNTLEHIAPKSRASVPAGHLAGSQRDFLLLG